MGYLLYLHECIWIMKRIFIFLTKFFDKNSENKKTRSCFYARDELEPAVPPYLFRSETESLHWEIDSEAASHAVPRRASTVLSSLCRAVQGTIPHLRLYGIVLPHVGANS